MVKNEFGSSGVSSLVPFQARHNVSSSAFLGVFVGDFAAVRELACDGTRWYVADAGSKSKPAGVWIYDLTGKAVATEPLSVPQPVHLLYDGAQYLYIGSESTDSVYRLDTTAADPVPTALVDGTGIIDKTSGPALDGTTLFVASRKGRRLFQAHLSSDVPTLTPFGPDALGDEPEFVATWSPARRDSRERIHQTCGARAAVGRHSTREGASSVAILPTPAISAANTARVSASHVQAGQWSRALEYV